MVGLQRKHSLPNFTSFLLVGDGVTSLKASPAMLSSDSLWQHLHSLSFQLGTRSAQSMPNPKTWSCCKGVINLTHFYIVARFPFPSMICLLRRFNTKLLAHIGYFHICNFPTALAATQKRGHHLCPVHQLACT